MLAWIVVSAAAQSFPEVPELVNGRVRADVPVAWSPRPDCRGKAARAAIPSGDVPVATWAGRGDVTWAIDGGPSGAGAGGQAVLPPDLPVGVHRACVRDAQGSAVVQLDIIAPVRTQISTFDLAPNGVAVGHGATVNLGRAGQTTDRWQTSDFVRTEQVWDSEGRDLRLYRALNSAKDIYEYEVELAEPLAEGQPLVLFTRGTAEPAWLVDSGLGRFRYDMHHWPGGRGETRRLDVIRLPAGARLVEAPDLTVRERDGRVEVAHWSRIPEGGSVRVSFRYELPGAVAGLPGPAVIDTFPATGAVDVDPATSELRVTFDRDMRDGAWAWVQISDDTYPETTGAARYVDARTCVLPVKLEPDHEYVVWINRGKYDAFRGTDGHAAKPYELRFHTR